jgi:hypothetical protein
MKIPAVLATAAILLTSGVQAWTPRNLTIDDTIHLMAGVMNGIVHEDHINYFLTCVNGTENMVTDIEDMVYHFSWPTFWGITEGLNDIKRFVLEDLPSAIVNCGEVPRDFIKLDEFFSVFSNTTLLSQRVSYNFLWYYSQIMSHFNEAGTQWDQGQFFNCGTMLGEALVDAVGDHSQSADKQNVVRRAIENKKNDPKVNERVQQMLALVNLMKQ